MKRLILIAGLMCPVLQLTAQSIFVTFTGTGAATRVDSVNTTNLTTGQSVTLPGNDTLVLTGNTGIPAVPDVAILGMVYPNPFSGQATFNATVQNPQTVFVKIQNLVGQVIAQSKVFAQPGDNQFSLSVKTAGIYMITLTTDQGTSGYKIICIDPSVSQNSIEYFGFFPTPDTRHLTPDTWNLTPDNRYPIPSSSFKSSPPSYTLGYSEGDILLYRCMSGIYTTIVTDSLISSKNYEVEFAGCTDAEGRNYSVVNIGDQTWMAENLAYLPAVSPPDSGSVWLSHYYVNEYAGSSVNEAKATANFATYGVLYNWDAATTSCPSGWHLPTGTEWTILTGYLTNNGYGFEGSGDDIGKSIAANCGWATDSTAGTIGNDQPRNNRSGFSVLPGADLWGSQFRPIGYSAFFWSAGHTPRSDGTLLLLWSNSGKVFRDSEYILNSHGFSVRCLRDGPIPKAGFTFSPRNGTTSTIFRFDASISTDPETATEDLEVRWDWNGDGSWDTRYDKVKTCSFQYPEPGSYPVILEVKDSNGLVNTKTVTVLVGDSTFTDSRDGNEYAYKTIGTQVWMLRNLAWLPSVSPSSLGAQTSPFYYVYGCEGNNVTLAKTKPNYDTYGVLYNWEAAKTACPQGWHLPEDYEWTTLTDFLGSSAGGKMKESGTTHWESPNTGATNESGFTALPGGYRYSSGSFGYLGNDARFWSSSENGSSGSWSRLLYNEGDEVGRDESIISRTNGFSVRCLKGNTPMPAAKFTVNPNRGTTSTVFQFDASGSTDFQTAAGDLEVRWDWNGDSIWDTGYEKIKTIAHQYTSPGSYLVIMEVKDLDGMVDTDTQMVIIGDGTFTDSRDGREYSFKTYGSQTWMIENLAWLPFVSPSNEGSDADPYYFVYEYHGSSISEARATFFYNTYGALYNWEAAKTACPSGWHLPSAEEWTTLTDYIGWSAGGKMKSTFFWDTNGNGNNRSGFSALPGGGLQWAADFSGLGVNTGFWSATGSDTSNAYNLLLNYRSNDINPGYSVKGTGYSVRCLRDAHDPAAPTATFTVSPLSGTTSTIFQFDASGSTDFLTAAKDLEVRWDWNGDGAWDTPYDKTKTAIHQYTFNGIYRVILEVKDSDGLVDTLSKTLPVGIEIFTDFRDGHEYLCTTIGTQTWMIENLAYLPVVSPSSTDSETEKLYHVYKYQGTSVSEAKESVNYKTYGVLYNWPAAMNGESGSTSNPSGVQGVCPTGWHLPGDAEWTVLTDYLGTTAGYKMKTTSGWDTGNGDNSSAFAALPAGYRTLNGGFTYLGKNAWFWSATADGSTNALYRSLDDYFDGVIRDTRSRGYGYSVRCVRD